MAFGVESWFFMVFLGVLIANLQLAHVFGQPKVPCYFIFGDSIVDNGNNNLLITQAKANYRPYGIDFGNGDPNGRFTKGPNLADFTAELLGFESAIPPFATATGPNITRGVNYGSGAAGILDETGSNQGGHISLNLQLLNHQTVVTRISSLLVGTNVSAKQHLSKCLYTVTIGSDDYLNNYLIPEFYPPSRLPTPQQFADLLSKQYFKQLTKLYELGARKIGIFGLANLGCIPEQLSRFQANLSGCVDFINNDVRLFNENLKKMVDDLNSKFKDAKCILVNATNIAAAVAVLEGVRVPNAPCCEVSSTPPKGQCAPGGNIRSNRNDYAFWDNFHPTAIVYRATARAAYHAVSPLDAYPFGIRALVEMFN